MFKNKEENWNVEQRSQTMAWAEFPGTSFLSYIPEIITKEPAAQKQQWLQEKFQQKIALFSKGPRKWQLIKTKLLDNN